MIFPVDFTIFIGAVQTKIDLRDVHTKIDSRPISVHFEKVFTLI